jgi:hypothetical protein
MTPETRFSGTWNNAKQEVQVDLALILFEEDGSQIAYCPALDVSGYGNNEIEAKKSFEISLSEFFRYLTNKKTFDKELQRLGWKIKKDHNKFMTPPSMTELLIGNENFSRIFNNFPFRKIDERIALPA